MNSEVKLYDRTNIDTLQWSNSEISNFTKNYWLPMMKLGSKHYINNVDTQMYVLTIDDLALPVTVNHAEFENSYVCSLFNHYITYTQEELVNFKNPLLEKFLAKILDFISGLIKLGGINQVVIIYNLLLSTNLYPNLSALQIQQTTQYLKIIFNSHTIIFRSINTFENDNLFKAFQENNYNLIGSRQIYLFNPKEQSAMRTKMRSRLKQDMQLIPKAEYEVIDRSKIFSTDIPRLVDLYSGSHFSKVYKGTPPIPPHKRYTIQFVPNSTENRYICKDSATTDESMVIKLTNVLENLLEFC